MKFLLKVAFFGSIVYIVARTLQGQDLLSGDDDRDRLEMDRP